MDNHTTTAALLEITDAAGIEIPDGARRSPETLVRYLAHCYRQTADALTNATQLRQGLEGIISSQRAEATALHEKLGAARGEAASLRVQLSNLEHRCEMLTRIDETDADLVRIQAAIDAEAAKRRAARDARMSTVVEGVVRIEEVAP